VAVISDKSSRAHIANGDSIGSGGEMASQCAVLPKARRPGAALRRRSEIGLFLLSLAIFFISPINDVKSDPRYSIVVSENILKHGTPALNDVSIPGLQKSLLPAHPDLKIFRPFYQLVRINGNVLYSYPHGSSLLSLPFVVLLNAAGISAIDAKGNYDYLGELWIQKIISSLLMAAVTCIFFESACVLLPWSWSLIIAIGAAFGTQIWSTASRALWSHTWEVFLAACLVLILLKREQQSSSCAPVLATLVSWMYFVRPNGAIAVVAISALTFFCYRDEFFSYAATGSAWLFGFLIYSWINFGQLLPDYYRQGSALHAGGWIVAFAGCLISPSRGLFVFVPSVSIVIYLVARHWRALPNRRLALLAIGIICAQVAILASWPIWWGGYSYGPRLLTDVIPWFVLLAILGSRAYLDCAAQTSAGLNRPVFSPGVVPIAMLLTCVGIIINGYGAWSIQPEAWNHRVDVDVHPERIWDWRSPQFLAGMSR